MKGGGLAPAVLSPHTVKPIRTLFNLCEHSFIILTNNSNTMPRLITNKNTRLWDNQVIIMLGKAKTAEEKALLALYWLTGARTGEILSLETTDFHIFKDKVILAMRTKKSGRGEKTDLPRTLELKRAPIGEVILELNGLNGSSDPSYIEWVVNYVLILRNTQIEKLFTKTPRWAEKTINRLGEKAIGQRVSPYHFRASFVFHAINLGNEKDEVREWLGLNTKTKPKNEEEKINEALSELMRKRID